MVIRLKKKRYDVYIRTNQLWNKQDRFLFNFPFLIHCLGITALEIFALISLMSLLYNTYSSLATLIVPKNISIRSHAIELLEDVASNKRKEVET